MGVFDLFRRKKKVPGAAERREILLARGRVADAVIIDTEDTESGAELARYTYVVQGVDFESSEELTPEQSDSGKYSPGATVTVRYDPRNHGNSILV